MLTDYKFEKLGKPATKSRCGKCVVCVDKCPAQAAVGTLWHTLIDRDEFFNAVKCRDTCQKRTAEYLHKEISICGICISVCPIGKK